MIDESYSELKNSLKEKYTKLFLEILADTQKRFIDEMNATVSGDYENIRNRHAEIKKEIAKARKAFLESDDYLSAKKRLEKVKSEEENGNSDYNEKFNDALSKVTTLNIKLNNSLKAKMEEESALRKKMNELLDGSREELFAFRKKIEEETALKISELIANYNLELNSLKATFGIDERSRELPFDVDKIGIESVTTPFEADYFGNASAENELGDVKVEFITVGGDTVVSENTSDFKS